MFPNPIRALRITFKRHLRRELNPRRLAQSLAWGFFLGVIPLFCGANIALGLLVCWRFKLNHLLVQFISNIIYPLQILLFIPFIKLGVAWFTTQEMMLSATYILNTFQNNMWDGICLLGNWNLYGLLAWLTLGAPAALTIYFIVLKTITARKKLRIPTLTSPTTPSPMPCPVVVE